MSPQSLSNSTTISYNAYSAPFLLQESVFLAECGAMGVVFFRVTDIRPENGLSIISPSTQVSCEWENDFLGGEKPGALMTMEYVKQPESSPATLANGSDSEPNKTIR